MTKLQWQEHARITGDHDRKACPDCKARLRTKKKNSYARAYSDAMRSVGMVKTPYGWE